MKRETRALVSVENVDKVYGNGLVALQDANLQVQEGEFVTLVGPSGCGKSTLLRIVAGLGDATRGTVRIAGETPQRARAGRSIGYVFQDANLLPWRTVEANVALPLELLGVSGRERVAPAFEGLRMVGLEGFAKVYPGELSGGMRMRVSIARALVTKPRLLLMDEPFGALDEISRQKLNQELLRIRDATGATVVFVTHNVFEAVYLSQRIMVMSARPGRIVRELVVEAPAERNAAFRGSEVFAKTVLRATEALGQGDVGGEGEAAA